MNHKHSAFLGTSDIKISTTFFHRLCINTFHILPYSFFKNYGKSVPQTVDKTTHRPWSTSFISVQLLNLHQRPRDFCLLPQSTLCPNRKKRTRNGKLWQKNIKWKNYAKQDGLWVEECHWLLHWPVSLTVSKPPFEGSLGPKPDSQHELVYTLRSLCFSLWSTGHPGPPSSHSLSRTTKYSEAFIL